MTAADVTAADVTVSDAPERSRYEVHAGGEPAGHSDYRWAGDVLVIVHTEVYPGHEGEGLGSALAREMLADLTRRGVRVRVRCPFVSDYLRRHPEARPPG